jgi:hypothetical protein
VVDRAAAPDNVTVAAEPLTFPEMPYVVVVGVPDELCGTKSTSTQ